MSANEKSAIILHVLQSLGYRATSSLLLEASLGGKSSRAYLYGRNDRAVSDQKSPIQC